MESLYQAYQSYENRVVRGEYALPSPKPKRDRFPLGSVIEATLGDFMIHLGSHLKRHALAGKPMSWSPLTGSKA